MKLYFCARYQRRLELFLASTLFEAEGHEIVSSWLQVGKEATIDDRTALSQMSDISKAGIASIDFLDLQSAHALIAFTEEDPLESGPFWGGPAWTDEQIERLLFMARGGRHVEWGIGLALGKRMIVVGRRENVFYYPSHVHQFSTVKELLSSDVLTCQMTEEERLWRLRITGNVPSPAAGT